ncbi:MAG: hypothetical protein DYG83_05025 [Candidatus Brocadia sp. AMX2]|uniref:hypothetical protein n=1 Tax=Candidatus Brocadia sinica TaxID=795830 RepID=UPI000697EFCC|nr:hypothetical protein [Candidatus Brocadia sinica]KAA0243470.1 MAG: hypothetical protein EDM70_10590 [Candidatus Brocadia sp. AMX2]MBC6931966.1 hypothetical protein [Candidatus Brocadia sp.]MBL1168269.1 hypothetical protein [Candidatus Brocadia sp. AMX1]NOG39957.1 hypothetical protein [Planctomycetota bacterium]KXK28655.1 MAG: hypothetical protein UZ01_02595 [Candidatus Brocadia sinica]
MPPSWHSFVEDVILKNAPLVNTAMRHASVLKENRQNIMVVKNNINETIESVDKGKKKQGGTDKLCLSVHNEILQGISIR